MAAGVDGRECCAYYLRVPSQNNPAAARFSNWNDNSIIEAAAVAITHKGSIAAGFEFVSELCNRKWWNEQSAHDAVKAEVKAIRAERAQDTGKDFAPWCFA